MVRWLVYPQFVAISTGMVLQTEILRQKMPQNGMVKFAVFMLEKKMPKCILIFGRSFEGFKKTGNYQSSSIFMRFSMK